MGGECENNWPVSVLCDLVSKVPEIIYMYMYMYLVWLGVLVALGAVSMQIVQQFITDWVGLEVWSCIQRDNNNSNVHVCEAPWRVIVAIVVVLEMKYIHVHADEVYMCTAIWYISSLMPLPILCL